MTLAKLDRLLTHLQARIFTPVDTLNTRFRRAQPEERDAVVAGLTTGWTEVTPDLIWGEPEAYFWFSARAVIPKALAGQRVVLAIEAAFGSTMGRSDPQCLVRLNGRIAQGADGNHREVLLSAAAEAGAVYDILIEAGTIENRRQTGLTLRLMTQDVLAEAVYYDLKVPVDVARNLPADDARRSFILKTADAALRQIDFRPGNPRRFAASLQMAQATGQAIYDSADAAAMPQIVATGHTHIDVAWLWRVRETRQKTARSFATALALMEEYPDYRFMYNQCVLLDYLAQDYPDLFARVQDRVAAGQWEIEGALWLEPDVNIAGGEALVRHIQYGIAYHQQTFGVRPRMLWLPDTFGYSAALPQLMVQSELDSFVTHKLSWNDTNRMPYEAFRWQGLDGTQTAAYFLTTQNYEYNGINTTYCPDLKPTHVMGAWKRFSQKDTLDRLFLVYGHGDGGGGPTRGMLENIRRMERGIPGCPKLSHEPMRPFFADLAAQMAARPERFPVWVGELYLEYHRGTLTSVASAKRQNALAEMRLAELELLCTLAGNAHASDLRPLWDILLLNQFHDILPGSSVAAVYHDSDRDYARLFTDADALQARLLAALPVGGPMVLNTLAETRTGLVPGRGQTVTRADGSQAEVMLVRAQGVGLTPITPVSRANDLHVTPHVLENARLRAEFNAQGDLTALHDKRRGRSLLAPGQEGNRLIAFQDIPLNFDAWDIDAYHTDTSWPITDLVSVTVVETGPLRAAIRFEWRYETSRIVQVASLESGADRLEFDTFIDWHEHQTLLKAEFPLAVRADAVRVQTQFGHVSRPTHRNTSWDQARFEASMHRWIDLSEPNFGVALLNDCKYGYDAQGQTIRLTLLKSPVYPWPQADQGTHKFRYAIMAHDGMHAVAGLTAAAHDFAHPLTVVHGRAGPVAPLTTLALQGQGVALSAAKPAEDGRGTAVRLWETAGSHSTIRLTGLADGLMVEETDLLESPLARLLVEDGHLDLSFAPFQIRTFRLFGDMP